LLLKSYELRTADASFRNFNNEKESIYRAICSAIHEFIPDTEFGSLITKIVGGWVTKYSVSTALDLVPFLVCDSQNCERNQVIPIATTWLLLRLAAKSFDDVEDGDAKDTIGETTNLASGLLVSAYQMLSMLGSQNNLSFQGYQKVIKEFNHSILHACQGQHLDLASKHKFVQFKPNDWLNIASAKSGDLFSWATWASALVMCSDEQIQEGYRKFGYHLGLLLQVVDDYNDFYCDSGTDLVHGQVSLPVSYAFYVASSADRFKIEILLKEAEHGSKKAVKEVRQLIIREGAIEFLVSIAWIQRQLALDALNSIGCHSPRDQPLVSLLNQIMAPLASRNIQPCSFKG
jgi:geranylgeranyl pyrophosphate synthase